MKISWFSKIISPELGGHISGYKMDDTSISKLNDLYMTGLWLMTARARCCS